MPYVSGQQLAERPGGRELAEVASSEHESSLVDATLMDLTLRGSARTGYAAEDVAHADAALARITDAVTEADQVIDGYLAKRYALPLSPVPAIVVGWSRAITRYLLHKHRIADERSDPIARGYRDALKLLAEVAAGKFTLGALDPVETAPASDIRMESDDRVFSRTELGSFR